MPTAIRVALGGSGFLGGVHAGALSAILDTKLTPKQVRGSSGGGICAAAFALGFTKAELHQLAVVADTRHLLPWSIRSILHGAYCNGDALYDFLKAQFKGAKMGDAKFSLQILATNVELGSSFEFSSELTPNVPVALACRASAAVPLVYAPVKYQGKTLIDAGVVCNLPVAGLVQDDALRIGLQVVESEQFHASPFIPYLSSLIKMMLAANEDSLDHLAAATDALILKVPAGSANFLDCGMSMLQKEILYRAGYSKMSTLLVG